MHKLRYYRVFILQVLGIVLLVAAITTAIVLLVDPGNYKASVIQTSENTYHIDAPNNNPEDYIASTCQKNGKRVLQLHAAGDSYDELDVVCTP